MNTKNVRSPADFLKQCEKESSDTVESAIALTEKLIKRHKKDLSEMRDFRDKLTKLWLFAKIREAD